MQYSSYFHKGKQKQIIERLPWPHNYFTCANVTNFSSPGKLQNSKQNPPKEKEQDSEKLVQREKDELDDSDTTRTIWQYGTRARRSASQNENDEIENQCTLFGFIPALHVLVVTSAIKCVLDFPAFSISRASMT